MRMPWEYSKEPAPDRAIPNAPTDLGREMGKHLARFCDAEEPRILAAFPDNLPRCDDCAFRVGTAPNGCEETLMDAIKCVFEGEPFYCHKGFDHATESPKRLCSGWATLVGNKWAAQP